MGEDGCWGYLLIIYVVEKKNLMAMMDVAGKDEFRLRGMAWMRSRSPAVAERLLGSGVGRAAVCDMFPGSK